jgi:subtilisin family serine protease
MGKARVKTIVYVHGIGNKPPASALKLLWDTALCNRDLGDKSRMAYWVNREYYPTPEAASLLGDTGAPSPSFRETDLPLTTEAGGGFSLDPGLLSVEDPGHIDVLRSIAAKMQAAGEEAATSGMEAQVLLLPEGARRFVTRLLTGLFLRDVKDYLFSEARHQAMIEAVETRLASGGPFAVVGHSLGSVIAYEALCRKTYDVPLFVTLGSPLGLTEVQDGLRRWLGRDELAPPQGVGHWLNVADRLDVVALDGDISDDFHPNVVIENINAPGINPDSPRQPHAGTGYLSIAQVRQSVREATGVEFTNAVATFEIAKDVVADIEDALAGQRLPVLIEVVSPDVLSASQSADKTCADPVQAVMRHMTPEMQPDPLRRYIAAELTRKELEVLRDAFAPTCAPDGTTTKGLRINAVWRNGTKSIQLIESCRTIQATPARGPYEADGHDIVWAVLDTDVARDHPHFLTNHTILDVLDCTLPGKPQSATGGKLPGHGSHVCGIIAGEHNCSGLAGAPAPLFCGVAPKTKILVYKVLDDNGKGQDSWIIKALDDIAARNEASPTLAVHGLNLSLGGPFDYRVYGCGFSPTCRELRRLWQQGCLVCVAAGNAGVANILGVAELNQDICIGDPANLDEAIAVGSVHKTNPHTYGISYFSSRGPTADGRRKPDLVAPGEGIVSVRADPGTAPVGATAFERLYVADSGTSMACPHVSGLLASFLSVRREFIGSPDKVKAILLQHCTDLGRDLYSQGAGMPNLVRMLATT